ncbi:MAG TPA: magnesium/cobalt transporter CorA [Solirubrobacteraceae bacterium]
MIIDCAHYRQGRRQHEAPMTVDEAAATCTREDAGFVWLGMFEPTRDELGEVQQSFGLHDLAVEDAQSYHLRPKLEQYDGEILFLVLRTARYDDEGEEVEFGEISLFLGPRFVISVRQGVGSDLHAARLRLEQRPELLGEGTIAVLWAVLDQVIDDYVPVVEGLERDIEEVEATVFSGTVAPTERVYFLRREVTDFYRAVHPLLGPLDVLERGGYGVETTELRQFFRDVNDHLKLVNEEVAAQRDLLTTVLQANMAVISVEQNDVVRKISGWAAILAVPTFVASVYGMNFRDMPELAWGAGYPLAIVLMVAIGVALYAYFKRVRWL